MLKNNLCGILYYIFKIPILLIYRKSLNEIYRKKNTKFQMFLKSLKLFWKIFHLYPRKVHVITHIHLNVNVIENINYARLMIMIDVSNNYYYNICFFFTIIVQYYSTITKNTISHSQRFYRESDDERLRLIAAGWRIAASVTSCSIHALSCNRWAEPARKTRDCCT